MLYVYMYIYIYIYIYIYSIFALVLILGALSHYFLWLYKLIVLTKINGNLKTS